jgi:antitoxin HicB
MRDFMYYASLASTGKDGGYIVTFTDIPEAITQGEDIKDALENASDCLEEAIANRIVMGLPIPEPSPMEKGQYAVSLSAQMAAKSALYTTLKESGITKVELAKRLNCDEKEVRRLLDPRHPSKLPRIESALSALGKRLIIEVQEAA